MISNKDSVRLNKFISTSGYAARRKADELILSGRVSVNSKTVTVPGTKIEPEKDVVKIDGEPVKRSRHDKLIYILLNKPRGYVTTTSDDKNRQTVLDLVRVKQRIYPVGRLDYNSQGLLLLTNDGELANKLMHPRFRVFKTYSVKLNKPVDEISLKRLKNGVMIDGRKTAEAKVSVIPKTGNKQIRISIHEGRNRQVRRMLEAVGLFIRKLNRVEYAGLKDKALKQGQWKYLSNKEVRILKNSAGVI